MTTALVTGGAGLIGSHILDLLLQRGYQVKILDNLEPLTHPSGKPAWIPAEAEFIEGDVRNLKDWAKALQGVHFVLHQAAWGGFAPEISKMTDTNVSGTAKLFEAIRAFHLPVEKIVVASSQAVYGEGKYLCEEHGLIHPPLRSLEQLERGEWEVQCPLCRIAMKPLPIDEGTCPDVTGVYSVSKYAEERVALALGKEFGIPTVALRYALTYGPRQSLSNPYTGICSIFSMRILAGEPPVVFEDGLQTRDFTFVRDVASANVHVMECDGIGYDVFNVGTGVPTTVWGFACILARLYSRPEIEPMLPNEFRPLDLRHLVTDNQKIRGSGWKPQYSLEQGLTEYIEWIESQDRPESYFEQALTQLRELGVVRSAQ
jgi:dTDP-L-rhamnose 4-epimerase